MITIPSTDKKWVQSNATDVEGNIATTRNITLDKDGYLTLSNSMRATMSSDIDADFDEAAVIIRSEDHGFWVETHDQAFVVDEDKILAVRPTQDATSGVPSGDLQSDATFSGGLLIVTQDTDVDYYDPVGNTWTDTNISLTATSGSQHPIEKFLSLGAFVIADVNTVKLYNNPITATPTLVVTLTIPADFYITSLAYFNQNMYIGTMNRFGGHAFLFVWNGYGTAAQSAYEVDSNIIYDICVHKDSIVLVTGRGQLLRFNGSGFQPLDNFPVFHSNIVLSDETNLNMFHNCLKSRGDFLYINLSTSSNSNHLTNQPEGIWCYDSTLGFLYHRYAPSNAIVSPQSIAFGSYVTATDTITVTTGFPTGTEVIMDAISATPAVPLINGKKYYTIFVDSTHVKLATTLANANAGTAIDITAQPSGTTRLVFFPNYDFGQTILNNRAVALVPIERDIDFPQYGTDVLWGGSLQNTANSAIDYLCTSTAEVENRGYFITPKIYSQNVTDTYNNLVLKFSEFKSERDKIVIKYRTVDDRRDFVYISGTRWEATWTSTTTFTTTETEFATAVVGDEVEFVSGGGSGICAHITVISPSAGTYTVTIDETYDFYTAGDKARFIFRNWKKFKTIAYGDTNALQYFYSGELGVKAKFLQLKVELRGVQTRIEALSVDNKYHLPSAK